MAELALSLTGFSSDTPVPGIYPEVRFAQGEGGGGQGPTRVLILAPKTSAGTLTVDTEIGGPYGDESEVITAAGPGSPAHRMARPFLSLCKSAELYVLCPTEATGSAAVDKITITGTATGNGVISVWIAGELIQSAIVSGDSAATIAGDISGATKTGLRAALASKTHLPVAPDTGPGAAVTLTGKIAGTELNSVRIRAAVTPGIGITVAPTADTAIGTSGQGGAAIGAGTCSYTAALATMLGSSFDYILVHSQVSAQIAAVLTQVNIQAEPSTGYRQKVVAGTALTPSAAQTIAAAINAARLRLANQEEAPQEHYVNAAVLGAVFCKYEVPDPSFNFDGFGTHAGEVFPLQRPKNDSAIPTAAEIQTMLKNGVIPIAVSKRGQPYIVRSVTTYHLNGANFDYRARDSIVVTVGDRFTSDLVAKLAASPYKKLTDDPGEGQKQPEGTFATPARIKGLIEPLVTLFVDAGWFDPAKKAQALEELRTGIDPQVPSRANIRTPAYSAVLLHQFGVLVQESSRAT